MSCHGRLMPCRIATCALLAQAWTREAAGVRHAALSMMLRCARPAHATGVRGRMLCSAAPAAGGHGARRRRPARPLGYPSWMRGALSDASNARLPAGLPARQRRRRALLALQHAAALRCNALMARLRVRVDDAMAMR